MMTAIFMALGQLVGLAILALSLFISRDSKLAGAIVFFGGYGVVIGLYFLTKGL